MTSFEGAVPSQVFAANLMAQLVNSGVQHIFVAPGSRSQALAIASGQLADAGLAQLHVKLDERSIGFHALGVARSTRKPVAVITTSGTAVANLYPAVLEAFHTSTPLLLLTADRPQSLRNTGANQTTLQASFFGDFVSKAFDIDAFDETSGFDPVSFAKDLANDAVAISLGHARAHAGPVHLNLSFAEPLSSANPNAAGLERLLPAPLVKPRVTTETIDVSKRTLVIAGDQASNPSDFDVEGIPVFAEPSSTLVSHSSYIAGYHELLLEMNSPLATVEQVVVLGKPTLSRSVQKFLRTTSAVIYSVPGSHRNFKPTADTREVGQLMRTGEPVGEWLALVRSAARQAHSAGIGQQLSSALLAQKLAEVSSENDQLVLGASTVIRDFDVAGCKISGRVFANRGLAGIDGTIAFASGIALANSSVQTRVVLGDLTALHDAGSLTHSAEEPKLNIQVIVVNDNGGSIFERLEVRNSIDAETFRKLFTTPQQVSFEDLAKAYGWNYLKVNDSAQLDSALKASGRVLIEVLPAVS